MHRKRVDQLSGNNGGGGRIRKHRKRGTEGREVGRN
jgi:hypothetical protein